MKTSFARLMLLSWIFATGAMAQEKDELSRERDRISAEKSAAQSRYGEQEKACYGKFAVNDCLDRARAGRREALADLRRQEISLNDTERRRKSAQKAQEIEERSSPARLQEAAGQRAEAVAERQQREAASHEKAAQRAAEQAARRPRPERVAPRPLIGKGGAPSAVPAQGRVTLDTAENLRHRRDREEQARLRKERLEKKQAESTKPASASLPVPP